MQIPGVAGDLEAGEEQAGQDGGPDWVMEVSPRALPRPPSVWLKTHSVHPPGLWGGQSLDQGPHGTFKLFVSIHRWPETPSSSGEATASRKRH